MYFVLISLYSSTDSIDNLNLVNFISLVFGISTVLTIFGHAPFFHLVLFSTNPYIFYNTSNIFIYKSFKRHTCFFLYMKYNTNEKLPQKLIPFNSADKEWQGKEDLTDF